MNRKSLNMCSILIPVVQHVISNLAKHDVNYNMYCESTYIVANFKYFFVWSGKCLPVNVGECSFVYFAPCKTNCKKYWPLFLTFDRQRCIT